MAQQNIKFESGLVVAAVNLNEVDALSADVLMLPEGAEIINVSLEVVEAGDSGVTADLGFESEAQFFSTGLALDAVANYASTKQTTLNNAGLLKLKLNNASTKGVVKVRAHFFYPSERMTEIDIVKEA